MQSVFRLALVGKSPVECIARISFTYSEISGTINTELNTRKIGKTILIFSMELSLVLVI